MARVSFTYKHYNRKSVTEANKLLVALSKLAIFGHTSPRVVSAGFSICSAVAYEDPYMHYSLLTDQIYKSI